jgi:hypothetical protein
MLASRESRFHAVTMTFPCVDPSDPASGDSAFG